MVLFYPSLACPARQMIGRRANWPAKIRLTRTEGLDMHSKHLPVPPAAQADANAIELLRVWAANGQQHVSLVTNVWPDPAAWGILLVDLAKHVAYAYQQTSGKDFDGVLKRIKEGFDAEWVAATDKPTGSLLS